MDHMDFPQNDENHLIEPDPDLSQIPEEATPLQADPVEDGIFVNPPDSEDHMDLPIWNLFQGGDMPVPTFAQEDPSETEGAPSLAADEGEPFPAAEAEDAPQAELPEEKSAVELPQAEDRIELLPLDGQPYQPELAQPEPEQPNLLSQQPVEQKQSDQDADAASGGTSFMDRIPEVDNGQPDGDPLSEEDSLLMDLDFLHEPGYDANQSAQSPAEDTDDQEYNDDGRREPTPADESVKKSAANRRRPVRKGRPRRKKGQGMLGIPQILSAVVWLVLIVAIGVTAGRMLWICAADVLAFGREDKDVTITIYEFDTMNQIIDKLYDAGLIRYKGLFSLYASISDAEEDIQPGIYDLNTRYDYHALVNMMSPRSSREVVQLTIPEGYSCRQIFALLEEKRICTAVDIGSYAARGDLSNYWFLADVQRGDHYCLEGFLFPDTYQFYKNSTPKEALERLLDNFEVRFNEEMRSQINNLNAALGSNYTVREVTIVASLIEKESANAEESPRIAGVIYNRLFRWNGTPAYLNIDATIIYALNGKTDLTQEDMRVDSPYNTYTHIGLPPTPISNPGLASLKAALNPENHNYYYYVLNPSTGRHQFSSTYEEHMGYVNQFAGIG